MKRIRSSFSNIVSVEDANISFTDHGSTALTTSVFCRDREGTWIYAGQFTYLTGLVPDGKLHFVPTSANTR